MHTSDAPVVHGQIKQSANFAFARIYESGHEVPFYQPLAALELFDRAIHGTDIATGKINIEKGCGYKTKGTVKSEYREGNATVQFKVVPDDAVYNTTTNMPNPILKKDKKKNGGGKMLRQRLRRKPGMGKRGAARS